VGFIHEGMLAANEFVFYLFNKKPNIILEPRKSYILKFWNLNCNNPNYGKDNLITEKIYE